MLKLLVIACVVCWVQPFPCPPPQPPEFILGYPICKSGYTKLTDCEFKPNIIVKYCYIGNQPAPQITTTTTTTTTSPEKTTTPSEPTTTPSEPTTTLSEPTTTLSEPTTTPSEPTTTPSEPTTTLSEPTTTPSEPTTTPSEPTTTLSEPTTTLSEPTTTLSETTTPEVTTTVEPSTTPKQKECGHYPVGGKMWNADISTECQPWLAYLEMSSFMFCNAVLVNEYTLLTDTFCVQRPALNIGVVSVIGNNSKHDISLDNPIFRLYGKGISIIKLKEKVNTSLECQNPICLPKSKDDYDKGNCRVGAYLQQGNKHVLYLSDIALLKESTCLASKPTPKPNEDAPSTLCSYPFVQGSSNVEKGGMLICRSKSMPSQWMLAGLTYDASMGNKKANQPVYYWDIAKLGQEIEPLMNLYIP